MKLTTEQIKVLTEDQIKRAREIGAQWGREEVSLCVSRGMNEWTNGTYCGILREFTVGLDEEEEIEAVKQAAETVIDEAAAEVWNAAKAREDKREAKLNAVKNAANLDQLLQSLDDEWYDEVEGDYARVPNWGPSTPNVERLIERSCAEGDIVSWDTRDNDQTNHRYLLRRWYPAERPEQDFSIVTAEEIDLDLGLEE